MERQIKTTCICKKYADGSLEPVGAVWPDQFQKMKALGYIDNEGVLISDVYHYPVTEMSTKSYSSSNRVAM